jgi:hypothetical protein
MPVRFKRLFVARYEKSLLSPGIVPAVTDHRSTRERLSTPPLDGE